MLESEQTLQKQVIYLILGESERGVFQKQLNYDWK